MSEDKRKIWVCLPAMNEAEQLPSFLKCMKEQTYKLFELSVCVNQPEDYWENKKDIALNNQQSIELLSQEQELEIIITDRSSRSKGWNKKHYGVGWARKTCMDAAAELAKKEDLIVCVDADTYYPPNYFDSLINNFNTHTKQLGLAVPYYHPLTEDDGLNRHILRYEIYMRNYALNMWNIRNPYAYTAVGSSMVCTKQTYQKIGGMTPHKSGEDFYFLQKIRKAGILGVYNAVNTQPAARYSDRVFFGTGPALIKGADGDWSSYPVYTYQQFVNIKETFDAFSSLYKNPDLDYPLKVFLQETFSCNDPFEKLRENAKTEATFIKACIQKVDGLRILQYLKLNRKEIQCSDSKVLLEMLDQLYKGEHRLTKDFSLENSSTEVLADLRDFLFNKEQEYLKKYHNENA